MNTRPTHTPKTRTNIPSLMSEELQQNTTVIGEEYSGIYSTADFIKQSLFLIGVENIYSTRTRYLIQTYYNTLRFVVSSTFVRTAPKIAPLQVNPNIEDELQSTWYDLPADFIEWGNHIFPVIYNLDKYGNTVFSGPTPVIQKGEQTIFSYVGVPSLSLLDHDVRMAIQFKFLWDICKIQESSAKYEQSLMAQYMYHAQIAAQKNARYNRMLAVRRSW